MVDTNSASCTTFLEHLNILIIHFCAMKIRSTLKKQPTMKFILTFFTFHVILVTSIVIPPKIQPPSVPKTILNGQEYRILCTKIQGSLPLDIFWKLNEQTINSADNVLVENLSSHTSILSFNPIRLENSGNLSCVIRNSAGNDTYQVELDVKGI